MSAILIAAAASAVGAGIVLASPITANISIVHSSVMVIRLFPKPRIPPPSPPLYNPSPRLDNGLPPAQTKL
ncbi:uncharacterized protein TrAtP1_003918 [Trichoderma atroviride]|uniref:uncharacterized protein n=1 Tax=Hypocrea atroviridis TaxID=63577 RepID=UPI00333186A4|nr:hypothetical protein TrAtP1_003918 [Trichoderma atroviride]